VTDPATVVRHYFETVGDLDAPPDALLALLHPAVQVTEHPNAMNTTGGARDRDAVIGGFRAGKQLLAAQAIDVHEVLAAGDRVAVRGPGEAPSARRPMCPGRARSSSPTSRLG
jgi:ketosteroid isomerase-like protein